MIRNHIPSLGPVTEGNLNTALFQTHATLPNQFLDNRGALALGEFKLESLGQGRSGFNDDQTRFRIPSRIRKVFRTRDTPQQELTQPSYRYTIPSFKGLALLLGFTGRKRFDTQFWSVDAYHGFGATERIEDNHLHLVRSGDFDLRGKLAGSGFGFGFDPKGSRFLRWPSLPDLAHGVLGEIVRRAVRIPRMGRAARADQENQCDGG